MTPGEQENLDNRLTAADGHHDIKTVQALLAAGADVHAWNDHALLWAAVRGHTEMVKVLNAAGGEVHTNNDWALCIAAQHGHIETVQMLLAAHADVHAHSDWALRWAAGYGHTETVKVLAKHIFAPNAWRGKSRVEIEAEAGGLYEKIKAENPPSEHLRKAATILVDCALQCWEHVRPASPKLTISPLPAQPRPL